MLGKDAQPAGACDLNGEDYLRGERQMGAARALHSWSSRWSIHLISEAITGPIRGIRVWHSVSDFVNTSRNAQ